MSSRRHNFCFGSHFFNKHLPCVEILYTQIPLIIKDIIQLQSDIQNYDICVKNNRNKIDIVQNNEENFCSIKRRKKDILLLSKIMFIKEVCDLIILHMKDRSSNHGHLQAALV